MEVALPIAGWIVSPYIPRLLDKVYSHIKPSKGKEDLKYLKIYVIPKLALALQAVEGSPHKKELEGLVKKLKFACDDTEDILDELQYDTLKIKNKQTSTDLRNRDEAGTSNQDNITKSQAYRLKEKVKNIEELIGKAKTILETGSSILGSRNKSADPKTCAYLPISTVTGRDEVRGQIMEKLHTEDESTCLSAIGIWGIPGSGKTTLAQYIVKSVEEEKYFDLVMWIHVSKSFTTSSILMEMLEQASDLEKKEKQMKKCPDYNNRGALIKALQNRLTGKRILLVLDDIWFTNEIHERQKLEEIISPLRAGNRGSKVLVTSRHRDGVKSLGPDVKVIDNSEIPELDDEAFLELFRHRAFGQSNRNVSLVDIGKEIAQKLKKSPLLAVKAGGTLFMEKQDVNCWSRIRNQNILDNYDIKGRLLWCYQHLSEQAKRCFAYCSVFPRSRHLYHDELVNLWDAEGFISDTGRDFFDELMSVSFLKSGGKDRFDKDYFIFHDLLYDIAEMVAGSDCFKIEGGRRRPPSDVRHLSIESCSASMITEDIIKLGKLRTLIIFNGEDATSEKVFDKLFTKLTKLRVLIYQARIKDDNIWSFSFPKSIAKLKYLRYLGFQMSWVISNIGLFQTGLEPAKVSLPAELAKLYFLQVLDLGHSKRYDFSDVKDMSNLTNLLQGPVKSNVLAAKVADKDRLKWHYSPTPICQGDVHEPETIINMKYLKLLTIDSIWWYELGDMLLPMSLKRLILTRCYEIVQPIVE